jgi:hypothetical protein
MKVYFASADADGRINGTISANLLSHFPDRVDSISQADVVLVTVSYFDDFKSTRSLWSITKPWVLVDFMEYGAAWSQESTHLFGDGNLPANLVGQEWAMLDRCIEGNPPILTLKRELLNKDVCLRVKPIEFPCYLPPYPANTREQFNTRPLEVFHCWGLSHESRQRLHGEIFEYAYDLGIELLSDWNQWQGFFATPRGRTWASIYSPHYVRVPISQVMEWNGQAKVSVSLPGNGVKCFRHVESPVNSVMMMHRDDIAWSFPWTHGHNCLRCPSGCEFAALLTAMERDDLYDIYLRGLETVDRYRGARYVREYVLPAIGGAL